MSRKINIAVIGVGYWGKKVLHEYLHLASERTGVGIVAACDVLDQNIDYCRRTLGLPEEVLYRDHRLILDSQRVNAIHICTPNQTHYEIAKMGLEAGKHVLVEKPMTLCSKEAYELVDLAMSESLILQVGYIFRFNNALQEVQKLVRQGYLGDIYYLKLRWTTLMPPPNRDVIFDLAPHPVDILNYLLDQWPVKITCKAKAYRRNKLEELAYIIAEHKENIIAIIELSWLQPGKVRETTIIGSHRSVVVDCLCQKVKVYETKTGRVEELSIEKNNTIQTELNHFIDCITSSEGYARSFGAIGAKNVEMLEYAKKSLVEERTVVVSVKDDGTT